MAVKKKNKVVEEVVEIIPAQEVVSGVVRVTWRGGKREFSSKIHGAEYKNLASQFAQKHNGVIE